MEPTEQRGELCTLFHDQYVMIMSRIQLQKNTGTCLEFNASYLDPVYERNIILS